MKHADDVVLLAKEETVLQDMIDGLIEIERCCGMEMHVEKTKVMSICGAGEGWGRLIGPLV